MSRGVVAELLRSTGLPVVYHQWPNGAQPQFPCIRYIDEGRRDFAADNSNYFKRTRWSATLVSERKDDASEETVEAAFEAAKIVYSKGETIYISFEKLFQVEYSFELSE